MMVCGCNCTSIFSNSTRVAKLLQTTVADVQMSHQFAKLASSAGAVQTAAVRAMLAMVTATDEIQFRKCVPIPRIPWMQLYTWDSKSEQTRQFATVANHDRKEQLPITFSISAALYCSRYRMTPPTVEHWQEHVAKHVPKRTAR